MVKSEQAKESKEERAARIKYSENGRKLRQHVIPNKKKHAKYNIVDDEY